MCIRCKWWSEYWVKMNKDRWTVVLCCNMDGTRKIPLLLIRKSRNRGRILPKEDSKLKLLSWYRNNEACMTIFSKWLSRLCSVIVDNATSHKVSSLPENVDFPFLPPNITSLLQLDESVIRSFESHYWVSSKYIARLFCLNTIFLWIIAALLHGSL